MKKLFNWVLTHPKSVLLVLVLATVLAVSQMRHIYIETDMDAMLPKHSDAYINKQVLEERFGSTDLVIVGIINDEKDGVYNTASLKLIQELTDWLADQPHFRTLALNDLLSLATIKDIRGSDAGLDVEKFMEDVPETQAQIDHLKQRMHEFGVYEDVIVSADGSGTIFAVRPMPDSRHQYAEIYDLMKAKVAELEARGGSERFYISGRPVIEGVFGVYMPAEMKRMQPIVMALLLVLLFLSFRTPRGVLLPIAVVLMAEIWTLGTMAALGAPIYTITTMLPILILAIGIADAVHFLSRERLLAHHQAYAHHKERMVEVMHELWKPMLMTTVTTGVGFLSMLASDLPPIRDFGMFAAIGIIYALLITMLLLPAALMLLPEKEKHAERKPLFSAYVEWLGVTVLKHPKRIMAFFGILLAVSVFGAMKLDVNASLVDQFKPGDPLRQADEMLNEHFSGTTSLDVMIDTGRENGLLEPEFLQHLIDLQDEIEKDPMVGDSSSIAEFLQTMNQALHADDPAWNRVPETSDMAAQYLLLYSFSGAPDDFETFMTGDYRQAHIRINMKTDETKVVAALLGRMQDKTDNWFPEDMGYKVEWAGTGFTVHRLSEMIIDGQIASLATSILAIFLLCWWMFKRLLIAAIAMIPVSLAVTVNYGMMGNIGIPLDIATALTGAMALGIGVDFAIHYLHRYHEESVAGNSYEDSVINTNRSVGHAILFNTFVVVGGFLVLLTAALYPQMKLGALIAATMVICYLATCYLFPVLLGLGKEKIRV
ncbi:multidrug efflux protein [Mariprofundus micogutta]|uniref:Multidrug efflux protein n=1 Tax=Mariprofundus micogutta TaxID=1921010 RepID=A0A1L8CQL3_9PROT|nr:MMPL family transporter [Mariprofundus micogutta]GAV21215.1 multidrug efflux protein [Mariprofundus micogutta]